MYMHMSMYMYMYVISEADLTKYCEETVIYTFFFLVYM